MSTGIFGVAVVSMDSAAKFLIKFFMGIPLLNFFDFAIFWGVGLPMCGYASQPVVGGPLTDV